MLEQEQKILKPQKMLLTLPIEIDRKYRQEAKKREVSISEMLIKLMDERDYFEKKLVEKEKILEENTQKISKMIIESLSEIRRTNLELNIVSQSLISIPKVTDEARRINEHCTKSAKIIQGFNFATEGLNEIILKTKDKMNDYHRVLSSNKSNVEEINFYLKNIKNTFENTLEEVQSDLINSKKKIIEHFRDYMSDKFATILKSQEEDISTYTNSFKNWYNFFILAWLIIASILSGLYLYRCYNDNVSNSNKIKVFEQYKMGLCASKNRNVPGVDYSAICP